MKLKNIDDIEIGFDTDYTKNCKCGENHLHPVKLKDGKCYYLCYECKELILMEDIYNDGMLLFK